MIPDENLLGVIAETGPTGQEFEFLFENRENTKMIQDLGQLLANVCTVVPDGVVVFFPSYSFESWVVEQWTASGMLARISSKKKLFREPRHTSSIEETLEKYAACIEDVDSSGAILLAVVGGKMSEGINFKDALGRCVVMVGLPYPNPKDPILLEKMSFGNLKRIDLQASVSTTTAAMEPRSILSAEFVQQLPPRVAMR